MPQIKVYASAKKYMRRHRSKDYTLAFLSLAALRTEA